MTAFVPSFLSPSGTHRRSSTVRDTRGKTAPVVAKAIDTFVSPKTLQLATELLAQDGRPFANAVKHLKEADAKPIAERALAFKNSYGRSLAGKTTVLTGAAGNIGEAIAKMAAMEGMNLVLTDANAERLAETHAQCAYLHQECGFPEAKTLAFPCDITNRAARAALISTTVETFGKVSALIHSAGVYMEGALQGATPEHVEARENYYDFMMNLNVHVPIKLSEAFLKHLEVGASNVLICSKGGLEPVPEEPLYDASKAAARHAWLTFQKIYGLALGIKYCIVHPPAVLGKMAEGRETLVEGCLVYPADVADAVRLALTLKGNTMLKEISLEQTIPGFVKEHVAIAG